MEFIMHGFLPVRRRLRVSVILLLGVALFCPSHTTAEDPPERRILRAPEESLHPLYLEIRTLIDQQQQDLRTLDAAIAKQTDFAARIQLERQAQERKLATEVAILELQLRHAQQTGDTTAMNRLRASLQAYDELGRRTATSNQAGGGGKEEVAP
jgi:hypothetical protein